ncbi:hypothetical protein HK104_010763 [Borealophlyctis nickersoniae]|nr:hypothetical protein HK104_010763 [Borealophlyctis nickersoniae]
MLGNVTETPAGPLQLGGQDEQEPVGLVLPGGQTEHDSPAPLCIDGPYYRPSDAEDNVENNHEVDPASSDSAATYFEGCQRDFLVPFDDASVRQDRAYVQHMVRHLSPDTARQWWIDQGNSVPHWALEAFDAESKLRFTPVNTLETVKESLRCLRFELNLSEYAKNFSKLLSKAPVADSAALAFIQEDLKTWFLNDLRRSSNERGKWIAAFAIPTAMALCGHRLTQGSKYTWSDVTLSDVQEGAFAMYQGRGWSDERPPKKNVKVESSPTFSKKKHDKSQRTKPYTLLDGSKIVCFGGKKRGHRKSDCPK